MTALAWAIRLIIFFVLVVFAIQNTDSVRLRVLPGVEWDTPQIVSLLVFFLGGVILGALSMVKLFLKQRREILSLKRGQPKNAPAARSDDWSAA